MIVRTMCVRVALVLCFVVCAGVCRAQDSGSATPEPPMQPRLRLYQTAKDGYRGPFSTVGVAVHAGTLGAGLDIATPLTRRLNLRGTADFFRYNLNLTEDGIKYGAALGLNSGQMTVDYFPFWGFHISPGVLIASHDLNATLAVPAGGEFSLGNQDYYSSPTDPLHGSGGVVFARMISPELKIGFGNIIPRSGRHWSVPFEIGAAYIGAPTMNFTVGGTGCQNSNGTNCSNLATDPTAQANVAQEKADLNEDLKRASVYPIVSLGFSYKF